MISGDKLQNANQREAFHPLPVKSGQSFLSIILKQITSNQERMFPGEINPIWNYLFYPELCRQVPNPYQPNYFGCSIPDSTPPLLLPPPYQQTQIRPIRANEASSAREVVRQVAERVGQVAQRDGKKQKKVFKKDKGCPVEGCRRKYSSRIALRAHLRKEHPRWAEETSDYQP